MSKLINKMTTDYKKIIIDSLEIMKNYEMSNKQPFKARAYNKVINQLKCIDKSIVSYEDVQSIDGIGEKISIKIKEIIETGILNSAEKIKELYNTDTLKILQDIYGVGPTKATELVKAGITSITHLREEIKNNPALLNKNQKIGLKYYEDLIERIPYDEMLEHKDVLENLKPYEMNKYTTEIVGSFRRNSPNSGDIDVLIRIPYNTLPTTIAIILNKYVDVAKDFGYIKEVLALGEKKCMAICHIYKGKARRLDLLMTPYDEYAYTLLYFTGSDKFNIAFRQYALNMGYTLNEHALTPIRDDVNKVPIMNTEKDIFNFLELRYIEPSYRIDGSNIIPIKSKPKTAIST